MKKHARFLYQPVLPLGENRSFVTGCEEHWKIAKQAAAEGTVLLKNNGILPLEEGSRLCLFGRGVGEYLFGGGGSGRVYSDRKISLADALIKAEEKGEIKLFSPLISFYRDYIKEENNLNSSRRGLDFQGWERDYERVMPPLPEKLYEKARSFGGTALFILTRYSGEDKDRKADNDFYLRNDEKFLLERLTEDFSSVIVVLNVCGPVACGEFENNPGISALLYPLYGGGMAGEALCDILLGKSCPSGHLQDSLAAELSDYPSTASMLDNGQFVRYTEDIFVGYRYFESFCPEKLVYPFGWGLSYTDFEYSDVKAERQGFKLQVLLEIKNKGRYAGKGLAQLYLEAPQGRLGKAKKVLCGFEKTEELKPSETEKVSISFDLREFASFDDLGKISKSSFILEKGLYRLHLGQNIRDTQCCFAFELDEDIVVKKCRAYMAPAHLERRLCADGSYEKLPAGESIELKPVLRNISAAPEAGLSLARAYEENKLDSFIAGLSDEDLTELLFGHPLSSVTDTHGIGLMPKCRFNIENVPLVPTADGPAGLRTIIDSGVYTSFFPCPAAIAQSWNLPLARNLAHAGAEEVKENNIGIWLTPALNIHRSPLCGRNFEYYSEDPLCSGLFAACTVEGIQQTHIAATIKHFCCNNKENGRKNSESCVSERALREIYLRGFEICIKKADPWALMTSYNCVNSRHCSSSSEAINGIVRSEWGYKGVVMTDWWTNSTIEEELYAGGDVKMPEKITQDPEKPRKDTDLPGKIKDGSLSRELCRQAAYRILRLFEKLD